MADAVSPDRHRDIASLTLAGAGRGRLSRSLEMYFWYLWLSSVQYVASVMPDWAAVATGKVSVRPMIEPMIRPMVRQVFMVFMFISFTRHCPSTNLTSTFANACGRPALLIKAAGMT